jgi:hypothetical protein
VLRPAGAADAHVRVSVVVDDPHLGVVRSLVRIVGAQHRDLGPLAGQVGAQREQEDPGKQNRGDPAERHGPTLLRVAWRRRTQRIAARNGGQPAR